MQSTQPGSGATQSEPGIQGHTLGRTPNSSLGASNLEKLITDYKRSIPKFVAMSKHARSLCEDGILKYLPSVPAIFDQRCKDPCSLKEKMRTKYKCTDCADFETARANHGIPDVAAMRIALYYPNQNKEVGNLLEKIFNVHRVERLGKESGYVADHYAVSFKDSAPKLNGEKQALFHQEESDRVEIQVVSVLSHTWSQVEHKLKYKRKTYMPLSVTETRILKGLSGLIASGDLLLEELYDHQRENIRVFEDEYDLGSWLWKNIPKDAPLCMGDYRAIDQKVLFAFLNVLQINTPDDLGQILKGICPYDKTSESERKNIEDKFNGQKATYNLSTPRTSICLMDHILLPTSEVDQESALEKAKAPLTLHAYTCQTVLNALLWLHELFDHKNDTDEFYQILYEYRNRGTDEKLSVNWAYTNITRVHIARGRKPGRGDDEKFLALLWDWMENTDRPALKLVFRIAQLGVWQGPITQVLKQLGSFKPLEIISRESTGTVEENRA